MVFSKNIKWSFAAGAGCKGKLQFTNIRILRDDISTKIANEIYPLINRVENLLRRYLIKFFTRKIGVDWWEVRV